MSNNFRCCALCRGLTYPCKGCQAITARLDAEQASPMPGAAFVPSGPEPYVKPERGGLTERARARTVAHFQYARAVARKASPRAEKMTDAELDVDPFVEWVACLFGDFVRKHRDEAQPGEVRSSDSSGETDIKVGDVVAFVDRCPKFRVDALATRYGEPAAEMTMIVNERGEACAHRQLGGPAPLKNAVVLPSGQFMSPDGGK